MKTSNLNSSRRRLVSIAALLIALFVLTAPMMAQLVIPTQTKAPANTDIQNSASATYNYTDGTGTHAGSAVSNTVVTRVTPVYALDHLGTINNSTAQSVTGVRNTQVQFPHVIENLSNINDSYTISVTNPATGTALTNVRVVPDLAGSPNLGYGGGTGSLVNTPVINSVVPGAAVQTYNFWVVGTIPVGGVTGAVDVKVTSAGTGNPNKTVRDTWNGVQASILSNLVKAMPNNYGLPGTSGYAVNLSYVNSNYKSGIVTMTDTLPAGMTYVAGTGRWSGLGGGTVAVPEVDAATFAGNTWPVGQASPKVKMNVTGNVVKYAIEYVDANAAGTITFQVGIAANAPAGSTLANTANFSWDDGTGNTVTGSTGSVNFFVEREINVNLWNSGGAGGGKTEIVANVPEGTTQVDFPMVIQNSGNMSDNIGLSAVLGTFPAGTTFQYLDATNNQITAAGIAVNAGASVNVTVRAFLPPGPYGTGPFTATVTAASKTAAGIQYVVYTKTSDTGTIQLTSILRAGVDITVDQSLITNPLALGHGIGPEAAAAKNQLGTGVTTTTFMLYVNNTAPAGGPADTYNLTAGNTNAANAFSNGFSVTFFRTSAGACTTTAITSTGSVAANTSELVCATVTFPNGTSTAPNTYPVYFAAKSVNFTHPADVNWDSVTIGNYRNVTFTPAVLNSSAAPGGSTTYGHTVTNNGNVTEDITFVNAFTSNSLPGWTSSVDYNGTTVTTSTAAIPVAPAGSIALTITVTAPTNATVQNQTTTTVTYTNGGASLTASVLDNTSVSGYVVLRKYLYIDPTCAVASFTAGAVTWTQPDSTSPAAVAPGGCIFYKVTAQNLGSSAISTVNITDGMQQYTTLQTTPAASCSDPGGPCGTFSASQASGISASFATLNPNDLVTIYYAVKVAN